MKIPTWANISKHINNNKSTNNSRIATGYFSLINTYIDEGYVPVAICGKSPNWYKGIQYKKLAPKYGFFMQYKAKKMSNDEYIQEYYKQVLDELDPLIIKEEILSLTNEKNVILLCYEKPFDFCHRHIVSWWLGNNVREFVVDNKVFMKGLLSR